MLSQIVQGSLQTTTFIVMRHGTKLQLDLLNSIVWLPGLADTITAECSTAVYAPISVPSGSPSGPQLPMVDRVAQKQGTVTDTTYAGT